MADAAFDAAWFRQVLGNFPTGVAVVTAVDADGAAAGMAVGSFTSASLDPPLVAFLPDRRSSSWPRIEASGVFCVNILGADQETVCRTFAVSGGDKFADLGWRPAPSGSPILDGVVAWIDCDIDTVHEAGDHWLVLGRVRALDVARSTLPLVFFQGGYGRFSPLSLAAWEGDLAVQLRTADLARPEMESLADDLGVECVASAVVGEEIVLIANAGGHRSPIVPTRVGQRIPFVPPIGTAFTAWASEPARRAWMERLGRDAPAQAAVEVGDTLVAVRRHGYSVGRGFGWHSEFRAALAKADPHDPADPTHQEVRDLIRALPPSYESPEAGPVVGSVRGRSAGTGGGGVAGRGAGADAGEVRSDEELRTLSAPVFGRDSSVVLVLSLVSVDSRALGTGADDPAARLLRAAASVTATLGGHPPS